MNNFETTLQELHQIRDLTDQAITRIQTVLGVSTVGSYKTRTVVGRAKTGKRTLTPAAKQKIALAMKARWAEKKKAKLTVVRGKKAA